MKTCEAFSLSQPADPFTLLKLFQLLEGLKTGTRLELVMEKETIPPMLEKMLAAGEIKVSPVRFSADKGKFRVMLTKLKQMDSSGRFGGGCCLS